METAGDILTMARDAYRFTRSNMYIIENVPLQLYGSALLFSPEKSIVRTIFSHEIWQFVKQGPKMANHWDACLQTLEGHDGGISMVTFSPDGRLLASADKGMIRLWDPVTGTCRGMLATPRPSRKPQFIAFSPDSRWLASFGDTEAVSIWDPLSGIRTHLLCHDGRILSAAFSSCGRWLASGGDDSDRTVRLWDPTTGQCAQKLTGNRRGANAIAFSADGRWLAFSDGRTIRLWDRVASAYTQTLEGHLFGVLSIAFSPDSHLLATADQGSICLWNPVTGTQMFDVLENEHHNCLAFSPNGRYLMSFNNDIQFGHAYARSSHLDKLPIQLWDPVTGQLAQELEVHSLIISAAFSPDSRWLASADSRGTIWLWDLLTYRCVQKLKGHDVEATSVAFSPDSRWFASAGDKNDRLVRLWDATIHTQTEARPDHCEGDSATTPASTPASGALPAQEWGWPSSMFPARPRVEAETPEVEAVVFSPGGRWVASFANSTIKIWDSETGVQKHILKQREGKLQRAAFSPNNCWLASIGDAKWPYQPAVWLWDMETGACVHTLRDHTWHNIRGHSNSINFVAFSPDSSRLASVDIDDKGHAIRLWNLELGTIIRIPSYDGVISVQFSPDGRWLSSVGGASTSDRALRVWDTAAGFCARSLGRHGDGESESTAFSSDGRRWVVSGLTEWRCGAIWLWGPGLRNAWTGKPRFQFSGTFSRVAIGPGGRWFVSDSSLGIQLWDVAQAMCVKTMKTDLRHRVSMLAVSPNGRRIVSVAVGSIKVWDKTTGRCVHELKSYSCVRSIAFSPDGCRLASAGMVGHRTVRFWDPETGACTKTLDKIHSAQFSPNGRWIALKRFNSFASVQLWDSTMGAYTHTLQGHCTLNCFAFSPDSRWLASAGSDAIRLWDPVTGICRKTLRNFSEVGSLVFSPNNRWLGGVSGESIGLWDLKAGAFIEIYKKWCIPLFPLVAFSPDSCWFAFIFPHERVIHPYNLAMCAHYPRRLKTDDRVNSIEFSPDTGFLASAAGKTVKFWNLATGICVQTLKGHETFNSATFSPDGQRLATVQKSSTSLWDISSGACLATLEMKSWFTTVSFSPDGRRVAIFGIKGGWFWDPEASPVCTRAFNGHDNVKAVVFSPTSPWIASFGTEEFDRTIQLWNLTTGSCERTLEGHREVESVAFSPTSSQLLASAGSGTIMLWDPSADTCIRSIEANHDVKSVAFSPGGDWLVSACMSAVRVWDPKTGVCLHALETYGGLKAVGFSPDDCWFTSGAGNWIQLHDLVADSSQGNSDQTLSQDNGIRVDGAWIMKSEEKLLWLPPKYRSSCATVSGSKLGIGCVSGDVLILEINTMLGAPINEGG